MHGSNPAPASGSGSPLILSRVDREEEPALPVNLNVARSDVPSLTVRFKITFPEPSVVPLRTSVSSVVPPLLYEYRPVPLRTPPFWEKFTSRFG